MIGRVLDATNPELIAKLNAGLITSEQAAVQYDYTWPLVMLACLGIAAFIISLILKVVDKKRHLGLETPNIK